MLFHSLTEDCDVVKVGTSPMLLNTRETGVHGTLKELRPIAKTKEHCAVSKKSVVPGGSGRTFVIFPEFELQLLTGCI